MQAHGEAVLAVAHTLGRDRGLAAKRAAELADDHTALVTVDVLADQRRAPAVAAAGALGGELIDCDPQQQPFEVLAALEPDVGGCR